MRPEITPCILRACWENVVLTKTGVRFITSQPTKFTVIRIYGINLTSDPRSC
jgi:hypothetical protein